MFDVTLYTFAKKQRSTKIPSGTGTTVSCQAKDPLDILNPTIRLQLSGGAAANPQAFNYARINALERWYHIRTWRNVGPLWEADLQVDALASWRLTLGAQSIYVYRSATSYNGDIVDTLYPTIAQVHRLVVTLPKMWTLDSAASGASQGTGLYIIGITGEGQTRYYGFTAANLNTFMANLFDGSYYNAVLTDFGAVEYPEAKVAINPLQYLSSIRYYPCGFGVPGTAWGLHITGAVSEIQVGPVPVQATASVFTAQGSYVDQTSYNSSYYDLDITGSDFRHPQADARGDFLQLSPYTTYEAVIPPWGIIRLDSSDLLDADYLRMRITVDIRSGSGVLTLSALHGTPVKEIILSRTTAQVGIECPLSQVVTPGSSPLSILAGAATGIASALAGNIPGALGSLHSTVGSAVEGRIPHLAVVGSQGSGAAMAGTPHLSVTHTYVANDDLADRGRPLCAVRQISGIPGYIMGDPDSLSIACTLQEMEEIRQAVAGGFYYE